MSKASSEQTMHEHERIVETAERVFRERGFHGVGIADLMKTVGLTHEGFCGQFESKEDLMADACCNDAVDFYDQWVERLVQAPRKNWAALGAFYLTKENRDHRARGCVTATLGADNALQGLKVRTTMTKVIRRSFALVMELVPGRKEKAKRRPPSRASPPW